MNYKWPLNTSNFTLFDRVKIASLFLRTDRWTQGKYVLEYEKQMARFVNKKYAVFVSSGSTANTLMAMHVADTVSKERNIVVLPAITWQTSCAPWIREGFEPRFIDVNKKNLSMDLDELEKFLEKNHKSVAVVFPTILLGISFPIDRLVEISKKYSEIRFMIDNCENLLSQYYSSSQVELEDYFHFTCSTSTYFGHQTTSIEGGFIFTDDHKEYEYFLMARNHGMLRGLDFGAKESKQKYANPNVNPSFDFVLLGNNFRNTDVNAYIGLLDIKRLNEYAVRRDFLAELFYSELNNDLFYNYYHDDKPVYVIDKYNHTYIRYGRNALFALPIVLKIGDEYKFQSIQNELNNLSIESRPIISGNLLKQTCYKRFRFGKKYSNAEHIHKFGCYVGLYPKLTERQVINLAKELNKI